jgi:hypothetical protein
MEATLLQYRSHYSITLQISPSSHVIGWAAVNVIATSTRNCRNLSEGFAGDPWLSIMLTLCHILHSVSHWPVLVYCIKLKQTRQQQ